MPGFSEKPGICNVELAQYLLAASLAVVAAVANNQGETNRCDYNHEKLTHLSELETIPMRKAATCFVVVAMALVAVYCTNHADADGPKKVRRAKPPEFTEDSARNVFFNDVFQDALVGERPQNIGQVVARPVNGGSGTDSGGSSTSSDGSGGLYAWSKVISPTAIEDEIKALKIQVDEDITTPTKFAGNGFKQARKNFSILAMLFAIAAEYDGDVRWKENAHNLRDLFARSAGNAKVGTIQVYNEAKLRKQDLQDVVGGAAFSAVKESERKADWSSVLDRSPLMQRLELAQQTKLQPWTANEGEFKANKDQLVHEANMVAAMGEVLIQKGMEDGDEADYAAFAKQMRDSALEIISAGKIDNYDQARQAVGAIGQACSNCHNDWR